MTSREQCVQMDEPHGQNHPHGRLGQLRKVAQRSEIALPKERLF
jgi:hypothetical protein